MRDKNFSSPQQRNLDTYKTHRRQVFWQITLPLTLGALVILALAVLTVVAAASGGEIISRWGNISLIWLILPMLPIVLVFLLLAAGMIYALIKLIGVFPTYAWQVQQLLLSLQASVHSIADKTVEPVIKAHSFLAAVRRLAGR